MKSPALWGFHLLILILSAGAAIAQDSPSDPAPSETTDSAKSDPFKEAIEKATDAKRQRLTSRMQEEVSAIKLIAKFDDQIAQSLIESTPPLFEEYIAQWNKRASAQLSELREKHPKLKVEQLTQILLATEDPTGKVVDGSKETDKPVESALPKAPDWPELTTAWGETLRSKLSPEQLSRLQEFEKTRTDRIDKQILKFRGQVRTWLESASKETIPELKQTITLNEERSKAINALFEQALNKSIDTYTSTLRRWLAALNHSQLEKALKNANGQWEDFPYALAYIPPQNQPLWKDGLAKFLTAEESKLISDTRAALKESEFKLWSKLLVAELDQSVAFSPTQRQQLEPVALDLVRKVKNLSDHAQNPYYMFQSRQFFSAGKTATDEQLKPILSPEQIARWREAYAAKPAGPNVATTKEDSASDLKTEPEEIERAISDFLAPKAHARQTSQRKKMLLKAEEASRAGNLTGAAADRLRSAALGAVENSQLGWRTQVERTARDKLLNCKPENARIRLATLQEYQFQNGGDQPPEKQALWENTLKAELTAEQLEHWKQLEAERTEYQNATSTEIALHTFKLQLMLKAEQMEKIREKLLGVLKEYGPEIRGRFTTAWFKQYYGTAIPFAGIPEAEMKELLTKAQWEHWKDSDAFNHAQSTWETIRHQHDQRVKPKQP